MKAASGFASVATLPPAPAQRDHHTRVIVLIVNVLGLLSLFFVSMSHTREATLWLFGFLQVVLYGSHFVYLRTRADCDLLDGLNILNGGLFLHFTLAPFLLSYEVMPSFYAALWDEHDLALGLVLTHAMCVMIQAGYYCGALLGRGRPVLDGHTAESRLVLAVALVIGLGLLAHVVPSTEFLPLALVEGGLYIVVTSIVHYLPFFLVILTPARSSRWTVGVVFVGVVYSAAVSLFSGIGSKAGVVNVILAYIIYRHYCVKRVGWRQLTIGVLLGVSVVVYMNYLRAVGYVSNVTAELANPLAAANQAAFWAGGVSSTLTPFEALLVVLRTFPDVLPYQNGVRILEDMIYPIFPRALFPEKPAVYGVGFFWDYHLGFLTSEQRIFEAISLPGYFYVDFGVVGVLLGGLLVGTIQRVAYKTLVLNGASRGSICIYGILGAFSLTAARAFVWTTYAVIASVIIPILIVRLLQSR